MDDRDRITARAIEIARSGEGAVVAEICWLTHKVNEMELRIKRLYEIIEEQSPNAKHEARP